MASVCQCNLIRKLKALESFPINSPGFWPTMRRLAKGGHNQRETNGPGCPPLPYFTNVHDLQGSQSLQYEQNFHE